MSTFRFGEIKIEVHRMGPDPLRSNSDFYAVKISQGDTWMESRLERPKANRTAGSDFEIASEMLSNFYLIAREPEVWAQEMQEEGKMSQEEIDAAVAVANNLGPYLNDAIRSTRGKFDLFSEHFEAGVGPYDPSMGISRLKLHLPERIRTKEDIANFFAYLFIVDHTAFHPDDSFGEYVDSSGKAAYSDKEAALRDELMDQAIKVAKKAKLDIYELGLWVGALSGENFDPENEATAPAWLKKLSNTWV